MNICTLKVQKFSTEVSQSISIRFDKNLKPYGIDPIKTLWGGGYKWQNQ